MPGLPQLVAWTLGALGGIALARLLNREWQRVNAELDMARGVPVSDAERESMPKLQRDPATGIYRPNT